MNTELFKELKTFCKNKGLEEREAAYLLGLFTKHNEALRQPPVMRSLQSDGIVWLNREIANRRRAISEWDRIALKQNICDNYGRNPIDKLRSEIKLIEGIRSALEKSNDA